MIALKAATDALEVADAAETPGLLTVTPNQTPSASTAAANLSSTEKVFTAEELMQLNSTAHNVNAPAQ